mgnify:CR=1 FL=1|tara:strand:- start:649 stop:909 length:261 start_codon:yes stop_codon:yes gene_type:complete
MRALAFVSVPTTVEIANSLLESSKSTHDIAIDTITAATTSVIYSPLPDMTKTVLVAALSHITLCGDAIGHKLLELYLFVIANVITH